MAGDCNDSNPNINPSSNELCDELDNNCNGLTDEGLQTDNFYRDVDGDGFGDSNNMVTACIMPAGYVKNGDDCNDQDVNINPQSAEICDNADNNCNGIIDDNAAFQTFYLDADNDGFGNPEITIEDCEIQNGYALVAGDCNDSDPMINPDASELCDGIDNNCNNLSDENLSASVYFRDVDGDGYGVTSSTMTSCSQPDGFAAEAGDCDDSNPLISPGATDPCDGIDNNCNGQIDENSNLQTYYFDNDGDGYGIANNTLEACTQPDNYALQSGDCDDNNENIYPSSLEFCDGIDNNCNGQTDENISSSVYFRDEDGDGYGVTTATMTSCVRPVGFAAEAGDCNDSDPLINPSVSDLCDGIDNNCNGIQDEDSNSETYYFDNDGDGYGSTNNVLTSCIELPNYVLLPGDCDDNNENINPDSPELCDGLDNNCDGFADENGTDTVFYRDADGDGYGIESNSLTACEQPIGFVPQAGDCNDTNPNINPDGTELCDDIDNNCNGLTDENTNETTFYRDADGDGFGITADSQIACAPPTGYVLEAGDCDDNNPNVNPATAELCDQLDNNCDGLVDENVSDQEFYRDADGDGYGSTSDFITACSEPLGYTKEAGDCDDSNPDIHPAAQDPCDGLDNNCNNSIDEDAVVQTYYLDQDGDGYGNNNDTVESCTPPFGYVLQGGDCDDSNENVHPNGVELCDQLDNNCNGELDENVNETVFYRDADRDGYGNPDNTFVACLPPTGFVLQAGDCNDGDSDINPGTPDLCDGLDNNCNGSLDEDAVMQAYYLDNDGDGFGNDNSRLDDCMLPADNYVLQGGDCNDDNENIHPNSEEFCDQIDNNCNGTIDENVLETTYYRDSDGDGFGLTNETLVDCVQPVGYATTPGDCDDNNPEVNPTAPEVCDNIDNNCDARVDETECNLLTSNIWNDVNGDGRRNDNESGIPNIPIQLIDAETKEVILETRTNEVGAYTLDVPPNEYQLSIDVELLNDFVMAFDDDFFALEAHTLISEPLLIDENTNMSRFEVSYYTGGKISGQVSFDHNKRPAQVPVKLYEDSNPRRLIAEMISNAAGFYSFEKIPMGEYFIELSSPSEFEFATDENLDNNSVLINQEDLLTGIIVGQSASFSIMPEDVFTNRNAILLESRTTLSVDEDNVLYSEWDYKNQEVNNQWDMAESHNYFAVDLQRSLIPDAEFYAVGVVPYPEDGSHLLLDSPQKDAVYYYRLKFLHHNGEISYSNVTAVIVELMPAKLSVFPNPAQEKLYVSVSRIVGDVDITILNKSGKEVYFTSRYIYPQKVLDLDLSTLPAGMYFLRLTNNSLVLNTKVTLIK